MKKWYFVLMASVMCSTAVLSQALKGSGKTQSKSFAVSETKKLLIEDFDGKIYITLGKEPSLKVEMDDNLFPLFSQELLKDGSLHLFMKDNEKGRLYLENTNIVLRLTMPACDFLDYRGNANVVLTGMKNESFKLVSTGNGDLKLEGTTKSLEIHHVGNGDVKANELKSKICKVKKIGNGDVAVSADVSLSANGTGNGDIILTGPATIEAMSGVVGNGKLRRE